MVDFSQVDFDLAELFARRFRKELYEKKTAFSNASFIQPLYDRIMAEFAERRAALSNETGVGWKTDVLKQCHEEILNEISTYADFCKDCKPLKRKK